MKNPILIVVAAIVFFAAACNSRSNYEPTASTSATDVGKTEAFTNVTTTDVTKMLREANMRFRVKEVQQTTAFLEKLAVSHGGYVAKSMYDIEESETIIKKLSTDSAEEIKKLTQRNHMVVYVLNTKLDSFLDKVKPWVDHLEFRHLSAYDYTIEETKPSEPAGTTPMANSFTAPSKLQRKYSMVTMDFYQAPVVKKWTIPNPDSFEVARGRFWDDFVSSIKTGWRGTTMVFNYFISFWPLLLAALIILIYVRKKKHGLNLKSIFKRN